jgi:hypothetical protein
MERDAEAAWHSATWAVSMYLIMPFCASLVVLATTVSALTGSDLIFEYKYFWLFGAAILFVGIGGFLDRRFRSLVGSFEASNAANERRNRQIRTRFRAFAIASFLMACVVARLIYLMGVG